MQESQIENISQMVKLHRRVHRGTVAAQWIIALSGGLLVGGIANLMRGSPAVFLILIPGGIGVMALAIYIGRLRRRERRPALLTVAAAILLVLAILFAATAPSNELAQGIRSFFGGVASNFYVGNTLIFGQLSWLVIVPLYRYVVYQRRWRHPVLLFFGVFAAVAIAASTVATINHAGLPAWAFAVFSVALPALFFASGTTFRALAGRLAPVGEWDGLGPLQGRRLFTGRQPIRVVLLLILAVILCPIGYLVIRLPSFDDGAAGQKMLTSGQEGYHYATFLIGLAILSLGVLAYRQARGRAALRAAQVRANDRRPPVLYLRQFSDEGLRIPAHGKGRRSLFERTLARRTDRFEEVLAWHLWKFGPVVSVGRPGDRISPLGSAREYLSDETWRAHVDAQMIAARLIVVQLGRSQGIEWEINQIRRLGVTEKTLFIVPPVEFSERVARWQEFCTIAARVGWPHPPCPLTQDTLLCRMINGTWHAFIGYFTDEWNFEVAIEIGINRGEEAHRRHRIAPGRNGTPPYPLIAKSAPMAPSYLPPPGWYPDAHGNNRWWDGRSWSLHTYR